MQDHTRVLAVIRHAKAEQDGPTDFDRELSSRGRADAAALGAWLAGQGLTPDHALVSAAMRTRQTWAEITSGGGWDLEAALDQGLYAAGPETALDVLRLAPAQARTLLVVGHNPTMASLAQILDDGEGDLDATNEMAMGFPTSAVALLSYDGEWAHLGEGTASVSAFHVARS